MVLFTVLPWGVRCPEQAEPGHAPSAPSNPRLRLKADRRPRVVSAVIWVVVWYVIDSGWISFRSPSTENAPCPADATSWPRPIATSRPAIPGTAPTTSSEYGFPIADERALFERLILEINQAGLSWLTILKKREAFQRRLPRLRCRPRRGATASATVTRLLADAGIIRNRLKVDAAIENARRLQAIRQSHGSFAALARRPSSAATRPTG